MFESAPTTRGSSNCRFNECKHCARSLPGYRQFCVRPGFCSKECSASPAFLDDPRSIRTGTSPHGEPQSQNLAIIPAFESLFRSPTVQMPIPRPRPIPSLQLLCVRVLADNLGSISDLSGIGEDLGITILQEIIMRQRLNYYNAQVYVQYIYFSVN